MKITRLEHAPSIAVALLLNAKGLIVKTGGRCLPMNPPKSVPSVCIFERMPTLSIRRGHGEKYIGHLFFNPERAFHAPSDALQKNWVFEVHGYKNMTTARNLATEMMSAFGVSITLVLRTVEM